MQDNATAWQCNAKAMQRQPIECKAMPYKVMQHAMQGNATPMQYMPIECNNNAIQGNATPGPQCKGRQTMAGYPHARHAHAGHAHARHAYAHGWQCLGFRVWCIRFRPSTGHAYAHAHARPCFMSTSMQLLYQPLDASAVSPPQAKDRQAMHGNA